MGWQRFMVCLALACLPLAADGPFESTQVAMRSMGVEEGLPNARVHAALRDRNGRLWVGTQEGAAYLGGAGWTPFPLPDEAPSNYIRALAETPDGALWFGTEAGGLWRCRRGVWKHWAAGTGLPVNRVNALLVQGGAVWVGTASGLVRIENDRAEPVQGPADPWIWTLASVPDASGRPQLWVGGENQVWIQEADGWRQMGAKEGWWKGGANAIVSRSLPGGGHEVWVSSWGFGVGVWDPQRKQFQGPLADFPSRNATCVSIARRLDGEEEFWVGTYDAGLFRRRGRGWEPFGPEQGFPSTSIYCLLANPAGRPSFWAGTRGAGLVAVDPAGWRTLPDHPRIPSRQANCFLETQGPEGGRVFWIGTDKGLVRWDSRGPAMETSAQGLPGEFITDLLEIQTPKGPELWASTIGGIARRGAGGRWEAFGRKQGLKFYRVQCLAAELNPAGKVKLYAGADGGLVFYEDGKWSQRGTSEGLPHSIVTSLLVAKERDGSSCLWVGTRGGGLGRLKGQSWQIFGTREGLPNLSVYGLAASVSPSGKRWLWVALLGGKGLARLDLDHPELGLRTWDQKHLPGLRGQGIQGIVVSGQDFLYLSTTSGVVRMQLQGPDSDPGDVLAFTPSDGLPSSASSAAKATFLDHDGRIWVGTAKGVAVLDPKAEQHPPTPPKPLVERVVVQDRVVDHEAPIKLGFRDSRLSVSFSLPVFHRHEAAQYRTQLLGLEAEPRPWTSRPEVEYTTLPPREYVLRIWARDGMGHLAPTLDLPVSVVPPPWLSWWAILLEIALLGGLAYLVLYRRHRILEHRTRELERVVGDRTRELADANEALRTQSLTDPLTGIFNRRALDETMGEIVSRYHRRQLAVPIGPGDHNRDIGFLVLDLDLFKSVNDAYGHRAGDKVLQQAAEILRQTMRDTDRIVRWGGEEFVVVAVDTNTDEIPVLAERLRAAVAAAEFQVEGHPHLHLTVSIGFASMPLFFEDPGRMAWEQVINLADQCLYLAKQGGRNRWVGLLPSADARLTLEADPSALDAIALSTRGWVNLRRGPASEPPKA